MKPISTSSDAPSTRAPRPVGSAIPVLDLGLAPYSPLVHLQAYLRAAVADGALPGVLLLLEHEPVITLGSRGGEADLVGSSQLSSPQLPVIRTERGGAATLHAPGQLVSYPILRIPRRDLRAFVDGLEQTLMDLLAGFGVSAERRPGAPGLYVRGAKIASVGLRCQRWVSSHGTSLNVFNDLGLFDAIVSCGEVGLRQTSILAETGTAPTMPEVKQRYLETFSAAFATTLAPMLRSTAERAPADLGLRCYGLIGPDGPALMHRP